MTALLPFHDAGLLRQTATNLFYGWGYNFYRKENQLRADDQLIRAQAALLLAHAQRSVEAAEGDYRRIALPAPSRAHPFPDPAAVANAQRLEAFSRALLALAGRLQTLPVPENDRMSQRFRQEAATLQSLIEHDERLVGQCELLRATLDAKPAAYLLDNLHLLQDGLSAITATLDGREAVLLGRML